VSARRRRNAWQGERASSGVLAVAGWMVLLLASLSFVTWRQTRGVEMERALRATETDRGIAEAERVSASRRVEELRGRSRIVRVARDRFGMYLPQDREIIFLPLEDEAAGGWQ
jgi:hypothetical protein